MWCFAKADRFCKELSLLRRGSRSFLHLRMSSYDEETGEWGAAVVQSGNRYFIERYTSHSKSMEGVYPEDISWSLYGKVDDFFVFVLSWRHHMKKHISL